MPDNYRRRRYEEKLFVNDATKKKRQRMEQGRLAGPQQEETGVAAQRRREREARRLVQEMEQEMKKRETEAALDPDKHYLTFGGSSEKKTTEDEFIEKDAITSFRGDFGWLGMDDPEFPVMDARHEVYPTLEHAFQAQKATSQDQRLAIREAATAREAKRLGGKALAQSKEKDKFRETSIEIMTGLVRDKFLRHEGLQQKLVATGDRQLVFVNDFNDVFWGRSRNALGRNELGKILDQLRNDLTNGRRTKLVTAWIADRCFGNNLVDKHDIGWHFTFRRDDDDDDDKAASSERGPRVDDVLWFTVGRDPGAGLVLEHGSTSRIHAAFLLKGGRPYVVDLGSAHGTFLTKRLRPFEPALLDDATEVKFGRSSRWFRLDLVTNLRQRKQSNLYAKIGGSSDDGKDRFCLKIANVSYDATPDDITGVLDGINVTSLLLPTKDPSSKSRHLGFAIVCLRTERDLIKALACDGDDLKGRRLRIKRVDNDDPDLLLARRQQQQSQK